jgi:hypothetical protein
MGGDIVTKRPTKPASLRPYDFHGSCTSIIAQSPWSITVGPSSTKRCETTSPKDSVQIRGQVYQSLGRELKLRWVYEAK